MIRRIFEKLPECVVLKLDGNYLSLSYFIYVAPEGSPISNNEDADGIELVSDRLNQIVVEHPNAAIMLAGDFNARIKTFLTIYQMITYNTFWGMMLNIRQMSLRWQEIRRTLYTIIMVCHLLTYAAFLMCMY